MLSLSPLNFKSQSESWFWSQTAASEEEKDSKDANKKASLSSKPSQQAEDNSEIMGVPPVPKHAVQPQVMVTKPKWNDFGEFHQ
jgi:hypothetical protein